MSGDFLTNIDWLLQSNGSIGHFDWFINPAYICISIVYVYIYIYEYTERSKRSKIMIKKASIIVSFMMREDIGE